jgi:tetratricopeptide (TPR) repeat protein
VKILLLTLLLAPAHGEQIEHMTTAAANPILKAGLISLYNLDYNATHEQGRRFSATHPDNPLGQLYKAGGLWWQYATEAWGRPGPDSARLWKRFDESVDATLKSSKKLIKTKDPTLRADGYFAAGMALGLRGQMKLTRNKFFGAYRDGKKGIKYLKKTVKIDPSYYDAYLGLGIFDYQVAVLPGVLKFGAKLLFRGTGGKEHGLKRIRQAIDHGRFASKQASSFLLTLLVVYEKDWPGALVETQRLLKDFPSSAYYRFIEVMLLHRTGDFPSSLAKGRSLFNDLAEDPKVFQRKLLGTTCGIYGKECLSEENLEEVLIWTSKALAAAKEDEDPRWLIMLRLSRGLARDILKHQKGAQLDYGKALDLPEFSHARRWAQRCWTTPCGRTEAIRVLAGQPSGPTSGGYGLIGEDGKQQLTFDENTGTR